MKTIYLLFALNVGVCAPAKESSPDSIGQSVSELKTIKTALDELVCLSYELPYKSLNILDHLGRTLNRAEQLRQVVRELFATSESEMFLLRPLNSSLMSLINDAKKMLENSKIEGAPQDDYRVYLPCVMFFDLSLSIVAEVSKISKLNLTELMDLFYSELGESIEFLSGHIKSEPSLKELEARKSILNNTREVLRSLATNADDIRKEKIRCFFEEECFSFIEFRQEKKLSRGALLYAVEMQERFTDFIASFKPTSNESVQVG